MKENLEFELNKKLKKYLKGRRVVFDFEPTQRLSKFEIKQIKEWLFVYENYNLPTIITISENLKLDFMGWDKPKYNDVLICKNNGRNYLT